MTYTFGRVHGLGSSSWRRSEVSGQMIGNPSVSESVASYMISLQNRKVFFNCYFIVFELNKMMFSGSCR